jgi:hypothetical protein
MVRTPPGHEHRQAKQGVVAPS